MKKTMYMVAWQAVRLKESEWAKIYERLVPIKCSYNERLRRYTGRGRVIGRIAGQITSLLYALLRQDYETLASLSAGRTPPEPVLYDAALHRQHRAGQYSAAQQESPRKLLHLPPH